MQPSPGPCTALHFLATTKFFQSHTCPCTGKPSACGTPRPCPGFCQKEMGQDPCFLGSHPHSLPPIQGFVPRPPQKPNQPFMAKVLLCQQLGLWELPSKDRADTSLGDRRGYSDIRHYSNEDDDRAFQGTSIPLTPPKTSHCSSRQNSSLCSDRKPPQPSPWQPTHPSIPLNTPAQGRKISWSKGMDLTTLMKRERR